MGVVNPARGRTALGYDCASNIDAIAGADGAVTRFLYDLLGRVIARVANNDPHFPTRGE